MSTTEAPEAILASWLEQHLGRVIRIERQGRWRPAWYADVQQPQRTLSLYVRGARADEMVQPQPLAFECAVFQLFERSGVRVPHVHGFIQELPAIVMDRVPGEPGVQRVESAAVREQLLSQFVDQMVLIHHRVDAREMQRAGAPRPDGAAALALAYLHRIEPMYERQKQRPEPAIEFLRGWLKRNVPPTPDVAYPILVDAGQFIFDGDQLTAMLDFELAALGDFHADLAVLRLRDRMEPIGDLERLYELYEERAGLQIDRHRLRYHTVIEGLLPALHMAGVLGAPEGAADYVQYVSWYAAWMKVAFESIFEIKGWGMDDCATPAPQPSSRYDVALNLLANDLRTEASGDELAQYQRRRRLRSTKFMDRTRAYQAFLEQQYLDDVTALLGHRPTGWAQADAQLERFILQTDGARDEALARLLLRQLLGQCFLLADPEEPTDFAPLTTPLKALRERT
ncbi:MAG: phosphotransferase [Steroidobacteraceae bacterium]